MEFLSFFSAAEDLWQMGLNYFVVTIVIQMMF